MTTSSDSWIRDRLIRYGIRSSRLANATERKLLAILRESMVSVQRQFEERLAWIAERGYDSSDFTLRRLEENLRDLRAVLGEGYKMAATELRRDLYSAGRLELDVQQKLLELGVDVLGKGRVATVAPREVLAALVNSKPFQGGLLKDWSRKMEAQGFAAVQGAVRRGLALSETPQQVVSRIVGKYDRSAKVYRGGLVDGAIRRDISAVVQTAYSHVQAGAREVLYLENADIIESQTWISVLDAGTTPECRLRHGLEYTLDGKPIGHSVPWLEGPGALHWNCRSMSVANLVGLEQSQPEGYQAWLKRQDVGTQNEVLGTRRAQLYRAGEVDYQRFYNSRGRWLTLEEVYKREGIEAA
jgi:hypothetical protein